MSPDDRTRVMGILNVTPDSFSDGGLHLAVDAAVTHARDLVAAGPTWSTSAGESTRPGVPTGCPSRSSSSASCRSSDNSCPRASR